MELLQEEKVAAVNTCQEPQAAAFVALQQKEDVEGMYTSLATTIQNLEKEVPRNEESMVASAQRIRGLEASVETLSKSGEGLATRLQGTYHTPSCRPQTFIHL